MSVGRAGHASMLILGREGNKGQGNWSLGADFRRFEVPETEALAGGGPKEFVSE